MFTTKTNNNSKKHGYGFPAKIKIKKSSLAAWLAPEVAVLRGGWGDNFVSSATRITVRTLVVTKVRTVILVVDYC